MSRITAINATPIYVERVAPFRSALGLSTVRVSGSFGLRRLPAFRPWRDLHDLERRRRGALPGRQRLLAPPLIGLDAFDINRAHQLMDEAVQFSRAANPAKAAVDMALYDIAGRRSVRRSTISSAACADGAPLSMSIRIAPIPEMIAQAQEAIGAGFKGVKIKIGIDRKHDIEAAAAIRPHSGRRRRSGSTPTWAGASAAKALSVIRELAPLASIPWSSPCPPIASRTWPGCATTARFRSWWTRASGVRTTPGA